MIHCENIHFIYNVLSTFDFEKINKFLTGNYRIIYLFILYFIFQFSYHQHRKHQHVLDNTFGKLNQNI